MDIEIIREDIAKRMPIIIRPLLITYSGWQKS
jgi:hypothetical protein